MIRKTGEAEARPGRGVSTKGGFLALFLVLCAASLYGFYSNRVSTTRDPLRLGEVGFRRQTRTFNEVLWGDERRFSLEFVNNGNKSIQIEAVDSSCGCTTINGASLQGRIVEPGDSIEIAMSMVAGKNPGPKRSTITLKDSSGGTYTTQALMQVVGTWRVEPDVLDFGTVFLDGDGKGVTKTAHFESSDDQLLSVKAPSVPWLRVRTTHSSGRVEILVHVLKDELPVGQYSATIRIETSSGVKPHGVIFVRARGEYELVSSPASVLLVGAGSETVDFFDRSGGRVRVLKARSNHEAVRVEVLRNGAIRIQKESVEPIGEVVSVSITDERGRTRTIFVSAL